MLPTQVPAKGLLTRTAEIEINADLETVYNYISSDEKLPDFLKKYGPIHAAVKTEIHKGPWQVPGAYRTIYFENGDTLREELLIVDPLRYFEYIISDFTGFAKHLATAGYGQFWFEQRGDKAWAKWAYSFRPKTALSKIGLSIFLSLVYQKFMQQCLQIAKENIERGG